MVAAKAARMLCAVVPEPEKWDDKRFGLADFKLKSLFELSSLNLG